MDDLRQHPQIEELMVALEKNDMLKEKAEVESLVDYIGDMEKTLSEMLKEMQDMRREINLIHNGTLKAKCETLVQKTESSVNKVVTVVRKVKENLVQAAKNATTAFKEKGREAFLKAVRAMKVPETLDKLTALFLICSKENKQNALQLQTMQSELVEAKGHLKNVGRLLIGKTAKEAEANKSDKGVLGRIGKLMEKIGKGFEGLAQKAADRADKIRADHVRESVKDALDTLKGIPGGFERHEPSRDR